MALDRKTGKVVWERVAARRRRTRRRTPRTAPGRRRSAITDGEHVIASFESRGIYAYDMNGKLVWQKDLGDKTMRNTFGEGSTPALHGNTSSSSGITRGSRSSSRSTSAPARSSGAQRATEIDTWATPLVVELNGRAQVITAAMNQVQSYDLETGEVVWDSAGTDDEPDSVAGGGGRHGVPDERFRGNSLKAIRLADAKGDITGTPAIAWTLDRDTPYVPSPLLYDGILYFLKIEQRHAVGVRREDRQAALSGCSGSTACRTSSRRRSAPPAASTSPAARARRVVLKHGPKLEVLAVNKLDDGFDASPALVDSEIYLRGYKYLYCIAEK